MSSTTDTDILVNLGNELFLHIINFICFSVLYGTYLFATSIALKLLLTSKPRSRRKFVLLSLTSLLFVINVLDFLDTFVPLFILTKRILIVPLSGGLLEQSTVAQADIILWSEISFWPSGLELFISDLLVIWRAIAIWDGNFYVQWSLVTLMTCNGAVNFVGAILSDLSSINPIGITQLNAAYLCISLVINAIGTGLIALRLWIYRESVRTILGQHRATAMQQMLLLLVESGVVFFMMQITMAVMALKNFNRSSQSYSFQLANDIMNQIFDEICSLYPVAVVIMINFQTSVVEATTHSVAAQELDSGNRLSNADELTRDP
ncbi:hypothetical protein C8R42DRAFT_307024 [Lentinula raphanica]|nr:hypothetical protein C8R42DRAFT_307024 [Lentinula raphanica]